MTNTAYVDTSTKAYKIAMESFASMAVDQPTKDRLNYRSAAMEAATGPDAGMIIERLYKSITSRASTNFGTIPNSEGDITRFAKYKGIIETLELLDKQMMGMKIEELKLAHDLHDNLIRLRESFEYGFRHDSQFIKTTYNTMVYSLCELLNLCDVIYIDMLKAAAEGKPFKYKPYGDLLLVQNIRKFNEMVRSGEWDQMMNAIRKDSKQLLDVMFNGDVGGSGGGVLHWLGLAGGVGALGVLAKGVQASSPTGRITAAAVKEFPGKIAKVFTSTAGGKVVGVILIIIATLLLIRGLIMLFWTATYKIRDVLEDMETLLKANIDIEERGGSTSDKAIEKQKALYNMLSSTRDKIEKAILKDDENAKKNLKKANGTEFSAANVTPGASATTADPAPEVVIG